MSTPAHFDAALCASRGLKRGHLANPPSGAARNHQGLLAQHVTSSSSFGAANHHHRAASGQDHHLKLARTVPRSNYHGTDAETAGAAVYAPGGTLTVHYYREDGYGSQFGLHVWGDAEVPTAWESPLPAILIEGSRWQGRRHCSNKTSSVSRHSFV